MKSKIKFLAVILMSFIQILIVCPNDVNSKSSPVINQTENIEKVVATPCPTKGEYSKSSATAYPVIINPNINNDIDKDMVIQGDSSIDPHILIDPPGRRFDPELFNTFPPEEKR
ncbi:hypothetical protein [Acetivibrio clariflavus]|uniref:Uncharacterized protein n=1 Tax=Acetivibrio clariflavus (strain DSM 19732 / NBRC 101661 / EBR45) TaxID=720554 RepID=G8M061_ACECE|nr:hypothetical protein [Acetivibrio clariflavus]AEV66868.1 hypothetical protein Clocl_0116 [Acetivibrio clariflavus DSM 19732]